MPSTLMTTRLSRMDTVRAPYTHKDLDGRLLRGEAVPQAKVVREIIREILIDQDTLNRRVMELTSHIRRLERLLEAERRIRSTADTVALRHVEALQRRIAALEKRLKVGELAGATASQHTLSYGAVAAALFR